LTSRAGSICSLAEEWQPKGIHAGCGKLKNLPGNKIPPLASFVFFNRSVPIERWHHHGHYRLSYSVIVERLQSNILYRPWAVFVESSSRRKGLEPSEISTTKVFSYHFLTIFIGGRRETVRVVARFPKTL
jgi:hypothetical protein